MEAPHQDLTIFSIDDDDAPILGAVDGAGLVTEATFSTDSNHVRSFLKFSRDIGSSAVDFRAGSSVIGQVSVDVVDYPMIAGDQDSGLFTSLLATASGDTALLGVRVLLRQQRPDGTWQHVFDGCCNMVTMPLKSTFRLTLRDPRERELKTPMFDFACGTGIFPRVGPVDGWGHPSRYNAMTGSETFGNAVLPALEGLPYVYHEYDSPITGWHMGIFGINAADVGLLTQKQLEMHRLINVARTQQYEALWTDYGAAASIDFGDVGVRDTYTQSDTERVAFTSMYVEWSADGKTNWHGFAAGLSGIFGSQGIGIFSIDHGNDWMGLGAGNRWTGTIVFNTPDGYAGRPTPGDVVYVRVRSNRPPTKDVPYFIEENFGQLLTRAYGGYYTNPATMIPVRYDADAMADFSLRVPIARGRIEAPVEDMREWVQENIYKPTRSAPAIRGGKVYPIFYEFPAPDADLVQLDNSNTVSVDWQHGTAYVVNQVTVKFTRDIVPSKVQDFAKITIQNQVLEFDRLTENSQRRHGTKPVELAPVTLDSVVPYSMFVVSFDGVRTNRRQEEVGRLVARQVQDGLLRRFTNGAQQFQAKCLRTPDTEALLEGSWCYIAHSWLPEYVTHRRGANRLAQIIQVDRSAPHQLTFLCIDAGPNDVPSGQPTMGALASNEDGGIDIPITALVAGSKAEVQYAIGEVEPAQTSGEWVRLDTVAAVATVRTPSGIEPNSLVWARARGVQDGLRPSAWTNATSLRTENKPQIRDFAVKIIGVDGGADAGKPFVAFDVNTSTGGVRIYYALHADGTDPLDFASLTSHVDVDADDGSAIVPVVLSYRQQITIALVPYTGFAAGAVAGTAGQHSSAKTAQRRDPLAVKAQGTVSVAGDGEWEWSIDGGPEVTGYLYAESTSAFPSDADAIAGTSVSGRQYTRSGGTPLTFGETIYVTLVPVTTEGTQLSSVRLRGSFQSYTGSKTTSYAPSFWTLEPSGTASSVKDFTIASSVLANAALANGLAFTGLVAHPVLPDGVTVSECALEVKDASSAGGAGLWFVNRLDGNAETLLGSDSPTTGGGWQMLTVALSEDTTDRAYGMFYQFNGPGNAGDFAIGQLYITYSFPDPSKTI